LHAPIFAILSKMHGFLVHQPWFHINLHGGVSLHFARLIGQIATIEAIHKHVKLILIAAKTSKWPSG
jgi:hypothetical protein